MNPAIRTEGLTKFYGRVVGVDDLSLEVAEGEVFGFLGPNGAGKTTTIRLLLDLVRPTSGRATIFGFDCHRHGIEARRHIGYLPGELPFYSELSGARFLDFLRRTGQQPVSSAWFERLLHRFDISDVDLARPMRDYSHGMKRKLGIVQALMSDAPLLVLDEPTGGLDPLMIEAFIETVHEVKQRGRTTVFLSSHVISEVEKTCDRVALIRQGRLIAARSLADFQSAPARSPLEEYVLRMYAAEKT